MSYPTTIDSFTTKINKNASGWYIPSESFTIPASPYEIYLDHVPKDTATTSIPGFTYTAGTPGATEYNLDLIYGKLTFGGNAGTSVTASYYSLGDDIMAEHMNEVQTSIVDTETTLGTAVAGAYGTVRQRLEADEVLIAASGFNGARITDNTVRAGALMSDIKGAAWDSGGKPTLMSVLSEITSHEGASSDAHNASAINIIPPGTTAATTVQGHVNLLGSGPQTPTNPHGMSFTDIAVGDTFVVHTLLASGVQSYNLTTGTISASGSMTPTASGANSIGTQLKAFSEGNFGTVRGDNGYFSHLYGPHSDLENLKWSVAGHTIDANITPTASGTQSVGTISVPMAAGNFDQVQAASFKTGASTGANGSFTSADAKTIIVKNGLIVSIV